MVGLGQHAAERFAIGVLDRFNLKGIRDAVTERVRSWDPAIDVQLDVPLADRVLVVPMPGEKALAAIHIKGRNPLTQEQYREASIFVRGAALKDRESALDMIPYSLQTLIERLDAKFYDQSGDERDFTPDEQPADAA